MPLKLQDARCVHWDGCHNAFTDIAKFKDRYYICFRHSTEHAGAPGAVRIVVSDDLKNWSRAAEFSAGADNRDPKFMQWNGRLGVLFFGIPDIADCASGRTFLCWSDDGINYSKAAAIGPSNLWIWKVTPFRNRLFGTAYSRLTEGSDWAAYLCVSEDGENFSRVSTIVAGQCANESHALFTDDGRCHVLVRREIESVKPLLAEAAPPYTTWRTRELDIKLQGPHIFQFKGETFIAGRMFPPELLPRTGIAPLDLESARVGEPFILPSMGWDTSYTGTLVENDTLYVSYYSRQTLGVEGTSIGEKATGIFLAEVTMMNFT